MANGQPCPDCRGHFEMKAAILNVKEYAMEHCESLQKENEKQWKYLEPDGPIFVAIDKQAKSVNRILLSLFLVILAMVGNVYVSYRTSHDAIDIGKAVAQEVAREIRRDNPNAIH